MDGCLSAVDSIMVDLTDPINIAMLLYMFAAAFALAMTVFAVQKGALAVGYAIAPLLIIAHSLIWALVSFYYRNFYFGGTPSIPVSVWDFLVWLQAIATYIWIILYRIKRNGDST